MRLVARACDRTWRLPLYAAAVLMLLCGPAASLGRQNVVDLAALLAVALVLTAIPLGTLAMILEDRP